MRYVVCYDIADNRRRKRVSDTLDSYGDRIQDSVFELAVPSELFQRCLEEIERSIDPKEDRLAVYSLCASCDSKAVYLGTSAGVPRTGEDLVFVV